MSKSKHYTPVEKKLFLEVLKDFSHVIEVKKSDCSTLRDKEVAWGDICNRYNDSNMVFQKRTVQQLKKLWTNMKQTQREALTKEKQSRLTTGGGPPLPEVNIDPDIAAIAPHLLTTAPVLFTSNMTESEIDEKGNHVLNAIANDDFEALYESDLDNVNNGIIGEIQVVSDVIEDNKENEDTNFPNKESSRKKRKLNTVCSPVVKMTKMKTNIRESFVEEDTVKIERIKRIMEQEKDVADMRLAHEKKITAMQENLLMRKELHALEIRAATAKAQLAELHLQREKEKVKESL